LTAILLFGSAVPAWPLDTPEPRATLKGIAAIVVLVESLKPDAERDGLSRDQLQTDVELRLRKAGIKAVSFGGVESSEMLLYLNVNSSKSREVEIYGYSIDLEFLQQVLLARDPRVRTRTATWSTSQTGIVGSRNLSRGVRDSVADLVDRFINAYLEQNPKP
jgi:hypothetical protein